jgi:hypothetical protein
MRREVFNGTVQKKSSSEPVVWWMRCTLNVRYMVKMGELYAIRAKLNTPNVLPRTNTLDPKSSAAFRNYHEYDGFVDNTSHRVFWTFEKRSIDHFDYLHVITGVRNSWPLTVASPNDQVFTGCIGQYITCHQDDQQLVKTGPALLELVPHKPGNKSTTADSQHLRHERLFAEAPEIEVMWKDPKVYTPPNDTDASSEAKEARAVFERNEAVLAALFVK